MAVLIQTQASFLAQLNETNKRHAISDDRSAERFARIEADLDQIKKLLLQHDRILKDLPEAIRQKIGFKAK